MLIQLIGRNEDLRRLSEEFCVEIINSHLVVSGIPYVDKSRNIKFGRIFCPLNMAGGELIPPADHTVHFCGEYPCDQFGNQKNAFVHSEQRNQLTTEIISNYYFSSRPHNGNYPDYYQKMKRYIDLLSAPARSINPNVSANKADYIGYNDESVFCYPDSASARAGITAISEKLKGQIIAIIGLGGTGSYLLDFLSKTHVSQISLFDADDMLNHNAFRAPGVVTIEELNKRMSKVGYYAEKYSQFRKGIVAHEVFIGEDNVNLLDGHNFVFMSLDNPAAKKVIIDYLFSKQIPFVDMGMGLSVVDNAIRGTLRKTMVTPDNTKFINRIAINKVSENENIYAKNVQISELNALNAIMGIIAWKKYYGFYQTEDMFVNANFVLDEEVMCCEI